MPIVSEFGVLKQGNCHEFEARLDYVVSLECSELHNDTLYQQNKNKPNKNNNKNLAVYQSALHNIWVVDPLLDLLSLRGPPTI